MQAALLDFVGLLRKNGIRVSVAESLEMIEAMRWVPIKQEPVFRDAMRSILVKTSGDIPVYEELFDRHFWGLFKSRDTGEGSPDAASEGGENEAEGAPSSPAPRGGSEELRNMAAEMGLTELAQSLLGMSEDEIRMMVQQAVEAAAGGRISSQLQQSYYAYGVGQALGVDGASADLSKVRALMGEAGRTPEDARDMEEILRRRLELLQQLIREAVRNALEKSQIRYREEFKERVLSDKSFNAMTMEELADMRVMIQRLAQKLQNAMSLRMKDHRRGRLDMSRTLRASLPNGGIPFDLHFKRRRKLRPEIVVMCDISDSVRYVSRFMLQLAYSLQEVIARVRSYVFVSQLGETTSLFKQHDIQKALDLAYSGAVINVYSHSNYGHALQTFHDQFLPSINSRTSVMVIGDARNNYFDPKDFVLAEIRRRAKELIWLNPESEMSWGLGDSEMTLYRRYCDRVFECRNLRQLERVVHGLLRV